MTRILRTVVVETVRLYRILRLRRALDRFSEMAVLIDDYRLTLAARIGYDELHDFIERERRR